MTDILIQRNSVRIPNLPMGQIVDSNGRATDEEMTFRQALLTLLEQIAGNEGLVMPQQPTANITKIQNATIQTPINNSGSSVSTYTCAFGTMIYDTTTREFKVAVESGSGTGIPTFKVVTIT